MGNILCCYNKRSTRSEEGFIRYGDTVDASELFKSSSLRPSRPYYNSELLDTRLREIRNSIIYIRENWDKYDEFMAALKDTLQDINFSNLDIQYLFERVLTEKRDWESDKEKLRSYNFHVIKLYTSDEGYSKLFSFLNKIFRDDSITDSKAFVRSVVFLIELLNIDLFNYCIWRPKANNFTGKVYRGMTLPLADIDAFSNLLQLNIPDRNIAIPLGLVSSSTTRAIADKFVEMNLTDETFPFVYKIHVIGLRAEFLSIYKKHFPTSVLSSICAVNVIDVSFYRGENEVLLRGPFFQVLSTKEGKKIKEKRTTVIEMVMINTNRDHITTMQLGEKSGVARSLFGIMVAIERYEFAVKFCERRGMNNDKTAYTEFVKSKKDELGQLMKTLDSD